MGITRVMAGIVIGVIVASAVFCAGYLQGRESLAPTIATLERANGEYRAATERSDIELERLGRTLETVRDRGIRLAEGIDGAVERANRIQDRGERIIALVRAVRTVADGLRAIYEE